MWGPVRGPVLFGIGGSDPQLNQRVVCCLSGCPEYSHTISLNVWIMLAVAFPVVSVLSGVWLPQTARLFSDGICFGIARVSEVHAGVQDRSVATIVTQGTGVFSRASECSLLLAARTDTPRTSS